MGRGGKERGEESKEGEEGVEEKLNRQIQGSFKVEYLLFALYCGH